MRDRGYVYQKVDMTFADIFLCEAAVISEVSPEVMEQIPAGNDAERLPLAHLVISGCYPEELSTDHHNDQTVVTMMSWTEVAGLQASLLETAKTWPENVRLRYEAMVDRARIAFRDSRTAFQKEQEQ